VGDAAAAWRRGLGLLSLCWGAKVCLVLLRAADGGGAGLASGWAVLALLHEDVWLAAAYAGLVAALGRAPRRLGPLALGAWVLLAFWTAYNVPVARVMSSPTTYAFLHATGGALGDSFARYLTPANIGVPLLLGAGGWALWRWPPPAPAGRRGRAALVAAALALVIAGPAAVRRSETLGLHRNAVVLFLATVGDHLRGGREDWRLPPCAPDPGGASSDLRALAGAAAGRHVVWVLLESTAARFLTPYGAGREVTPHLSALAREAVVFEHAYAAYPESIKGLYSMLCSRTPPPRTEASQYTPARFPCPAIAGELRRAGYRTGLFHSGRFAYLGMEAVVAGRGFHVLADAATIPSPYASSFGVDDRDTVRALLAFVDGLPPGAPFFALYMPIAGHHPYRAPGQGPRPFPERTTKDQYLNDLYSGDDAFAQLRAGLAARGLDRRTLYVVAGDHGEAFLEHEGNIAHALALYEENVRVPLWIAAPGWAPPPGRSATLGSLLDLAPTTLGLLGLPVPGAYEGRSLLEPGPRVARFFTEQGQGLAGLRDGRWKFLHEPAAGRARLFDLETDPGERRDLGPAHPERVRRYQACLE
jgi:phosphoglycerol transferase MdoB-like AlkP superfamily enzyme